MKEAAGVSRNVDLFLGAEIARGILIDVQGLLSLRALSIEGRMHLLLQLLLVLMHGSGQLPMVRQLPSGLKVSIGHRGDRRRILSASPCLAECV